MSLTRKENIGRGTGVGGRENEFLVCWNTCLACCLVFNGWIVNSLKLHWLPNALRMCNIYHTLCVCVCLVLHPKAYTSVSMIWLPAPSSYFWHLSDVVFFKPFPSSEMQLSQLLTHGAYFHSSDLGSKVTCLESPSVVT